MEITPFFKIPAGPHHPGQSLAGSIQVYYSRYGAIRPAKEQKLQAAFCKAFALWAFLKCLQRLLPKAIFSPKKPAKPLLSLSACLFHKRHTFFLFWPGCKLLGLAYFAKLPYAIYTAIQPAVLSGAKKMQSKTIFSFAFLGIGRRRAVSSRLIRLA